MTKIPPNSNDSQTLITLLTLPLKLEHIYHISSALKKQANEKHRGKRTLTLPHQAGTAWSKIIQRLIKINK
jgi:hypothetical protein